MRGGGYEEVYLISYYGAEYVEQYFRLHNIRYEWIYDVFERKGVYLQHDFFVLGREGMLPLIDTEARAYNNRDYIETIQCELYVCQSKYKSTDNSQTRRIALEKCLFLSIYMKNFIMTKEYILQLLKEDRKYEALWKEIQSLLDTIRTRINDRKQKDIIVHWLDCIPYGDERDMPYLKDVMRESVVFENAFTNVGYTIPTLRAMFLGKRDIDDRVYHILNITSKNSSLLRFLEEQGYNVKFFSGIINEKFSPKYSPDAFYSMHYTPYSMKLWDMLQEMLREERNTLWVIHAMETHGPYLSNKIGDSNIRNRNERYRLARQEVDEQLAFYDSFINKDVFRIYMSDHGNAQIDRCHVLFNIYHQSLKPRNIEGMFSLLDFETVLKQIILNNTINEQEFLREYIEIGNVDWYDKLLIEKLFRNKEAVSMLFFGWKGIIDKSYIYLHYRTGKEWLQERKNMTLNAPLLFYSGEEDICEPALVLKYRELAGEYPEDVANDEKFKYSHYIYALYHNILRHNDMQKRIEIINRVVETYPDNSIGIRMGGVTSAMLYQILSKENRKKIWGFIDNSEDCLCSKLHLPVVGYDQMMKLKAIGVRAVLISSYTYLEMLRNESKAWPEEIEVLDIYDCFDRNGIRCGDNFYKLRGTEEDYNVGFPFDEDK